MGNPFSSMGSHQEHIRESRSSEREHSIPSLSNINFNAKRRPVFDDDEEAKQDTTTHEVKSDTTTHEDEALGCSEAMHCPPLSLMLQTLLPKSSLVHKDHDSAKCIRKISSKFCQRVGNPVLEGKLDRLLPDVSPITAVSLMEHSDVARGICSGSFPHHIIFVNKAWCRLCGYSEPEVCGQTFKMLQGPETNRAVFKRMISQLTSTNRDKDSPPCSAQVVNYKKNGCPFHVKSSACLLAKSKNPKAPFEGDDVYYAFKAEDCGLFCSHRLESVSERELIDRLKKELIAKEEEEGHSEAKATADDGCFRSAGKMSVWRCVLDANAGNFEDDDASSTSHDEGEEGEEEGEGDEKDQKKSVQFKEVVRVVLIPTRDEMEEETMRAFCDS